MSDIAKRQFVRQQGFADASATSSASQYPALMFQPRVVAVVVGLAVFPSTSGPGRPHIPAGS